MAEVFFRDLKEKLNLRNEQKSRPCISQWACVKTVQAEQQCILCPWENYINAALLNIVHIKNCQN